MLQKEYWVFSYVVPSSLPNAGMIFFAISSFWRHILASVKTESAYQIYQRNVISNYWNENVGTVNTLCSYLGKVTFANLTCILAVGLNEVFVGSASKLAIDSFPDLGSSLWFPFRLLDFFGFVELYRKNNNKLHSRFSMERKLFKILL